MMKNKEIIINMYFIDKLRPVDISRKLGISKSAVTQVLKKDERYTEEKELRKQINRKKNIEYTKKYMTSKRKIKSIDVDYEVLKRAHQLASIELSSGNKIISNRAFKEWNSSIYKYNKKSKSYILKKGIIVGNDVPKRINWKGY